MTLPSSITTPSPLAHALAYAKLGWRVVPIKPGEKYPSVEAWQEVATTDPHLIEQWFSQWPDHGVGIATGPGSGVWVLDVDPAHGGEETLRDLEVANGDLPDTVTAITGGGGAHYLFAWPDLNGTEQLSNSAGRLGVGLDVRGHGGQVVVAPTCHPTTHNRYQWESSHLPGQVPVAPAPQWLLDLVIEETQPVPEGQVEEGHDLAYARDRYDFAEGWQTTATALLQAQGWHSPRTDRRGVTYLVRPGKTTYEGQGASIGKIPGVTYIWTDGAPPLTPGGYRNHELYTLLEHHGDPLAADKALVTLTGGWRTVIDPAEAKAMVRELQAAAKQEQRIAGRFKVYSAAELSKADLTLRWTLKGLLADPTYGMVAGELKTLKSYVSALLAASVASGKPFLDRFPVERQGHVLTYVGEGGRIPWTRRMMRVAEALGTALGDIDMGATFDVAPIDSDRFIDSYLGDLEDHDPVLFLLDPYYAYHGQKTEASNLHQEGGLLASLSAPAGAAGTNLLVVNHYNQTGSGSGLKRITQAGSGEWVDSWLLLSHREVPQVAKGLFQLTMDVGSRQWGGSTWDLDLNIGGFDPETGTHDGQIQWECRPAGDAGAGPQQRILDVVRDRPGELVKEDLAKAAGGRLADARRFVDSLVERRVLRCDLVEKPTANGRRVKIWAYTEVPTTTDEPVDNPSSEPWK